MAGRRTVGDDRTSTGERLEAGNPARRVHEHVRSGQQVAHPVGEPEHGHARLAAVGVLEPSSRRRVAAGQADHRHVVELERRLDRSAKIAHRPAAT